MSDLPGTYVLPLRADGDAGLDELTGYLRWLAHLVPVVVVDASPPWQFERHARAWRGLLRHLRPDPDLRYANGKVNGVTTGMRHVAAERVVIADDDVRYDEPALRAILHQLDAADLVRPQCYFDPAPWHARWDTARSLLNRSAGGDYPGTLGIRRSTFHAIGGYAGDVLFENLELIRTVRAHGGVEARPLDLYVRRLPPDTARFWSQRIRQAYDDFAQPVRMAGFLSVLPALVGAVAWRRHGLLLAGAAATVILAEVGRRRAGGRRVFPPSASLWAPAWVMERAVCSWLALGTRVLYGGVGYAGRRIRLAAHGNQTLRRHAGHKTSAAGVRPAGRPEPRLLVGAVTERLAR